MQLLWQPLEGRIVQTREKEDGTNQNCEEHLSLSSHQGIMEGKQSEKADTLQNSLHV